jgi:hypothetical protein
LATRPVSTVNSRSPNFIDSLRYFFTAIFYVSPSETAAALDQADRASVSCAARSALGGFYLKTKRAEGAWGAIRLNFPLFHPKPLNYKGRRRREPSYREKLMPPSGLCLSFCVCLFPVIAVTFGTAASSSIDALLI